MEMRELSTTPFTAVGKISIVVESGYTHYIKSVFLFFDATGCQLWDQASCFPLFTIQLLFL
jgi:hypothetical protein